VPQLAKKQSPSARDLEFGFQRILWGLVKKVVLADRLGLFVDRVYAAPSEASAATLLIGTVCFALQVYLDFSAYCDIAIGSARMMGISLTENFRWPLLARNPSELWTRWHITLSSWFRDYLFTALVGRKRPGTAKRLFNLILVMTIAGLWHGPAWHFVAYGFVAGLGVALYDGTYLVTGRSRAKPLFGQGVLPTVAAMALMHLFGLVLIVLFRARSFADVGVVFRGIAAGAWTTDPVAAAYALAAVLLWSAIVARGVYYRDGRRDLGMPAPVRACFWFALVLAILYGAVDTNQQFIYFQF
jgi:alginate O-acetyltransferase complex protein AlgI